MRWCLFFLILWVGAFAWGDQVRVLLDEGGDVPSFSFLGPAEFATATQKVSLYDSTYQVKLFYKSNRWVLHIQNGQRKDKYQLAGASLSISSLAAIQWKQRVIDFPILLSAQPEKYFLVGKMSMERYLSGVVSREMPSSWPKEALKAQVVASRSYAYWKIKTSKNKVYDLRPSVMDQVFELSRWGESSTLPVNVEQAIGSTEGQVLLEEQKKILKAYFHSDCGGETITPKQAWGEASTLSVSVKDPYCQARESQWRSPWSEEKIQQRLMKDLFLPAGMKLKDVMVRQNQDSQRVDSVDFLFTNGVFKRVRGEDFRRLLGYDKIRSTRFEVAKQGKNEWVFEGRGFGHGVGMCQHGARAMAKMGMNYRQILTHYYPQATLKGIDVDSSIKVSANSR